VQEPYSKRVAPTFVSEKMQSIGFASLTLCDTFAAVLHCADERQKENLDAEKSRAQEGDTNQSNETC
jgi:hypothetical protein